MYALLLPFILAAAQQVTPAAPATPIESASAAQTQQASSGGDPAADSTLKVQPGQEAIKQKDFYDRSGAVHPFTRMPKFVLIDQEKIWSSPFRTSKQNAKWWAIWGGTVGGLIVADRYIERNEPSNATLVRVGNGASNLGEWYTLLPVAAGLYFVGTGEKDDHLRETGLLSFEAIADVTIVSSVLKASLGRERPTEGNGNGAFEQSPNRFNSSFPSGHTITTFAVASVLAHEYPHKWWLKALVFGYGAGVGAARLAANKHFPGDVVAGGAIGWFVGDYVYGKRHNPELEGKQSAARTILSHIQFGGV